MSHNQTLAALEAIVLAQESVKTALTDLITADPWRAGQWRHMRDQIESAQFAVQESRLDEIRMEEWTADDLKIQE